MYFCYCIMCLLSDFLQALLPFCAAGCIQLICLFVKYNLIGDRKRVVIKLNFGIQLYAFLGNKNLGMWSMDQYIQPILEFFNLIKVAVKHY